MGIGLQIIATSTASRLRAAEKVIRACAEVGEVPPQWAVDEERALVRHPNLAQGICYDLGELPAICTILSPTERVVDIAQLLATIPGAKVF